MELNCLGESCPIPVIKTKKALNEIGENGVVSVLVDNIEAIENIEKMITDSGYPYTKGGSSGNYFITVTKGSGKPESNKKADNAGTETEDLHESLVRGAGGASCAIIISSDKMGHGSDELGAALLKTFFYTLTESETLPKSIIFYNSGVKITAGDSGSADVINTLFEMGVDILSCGACLKYYGLTDSLKAGRISNMYEIVEIMLNADKIITP